MNTLSSGTRRRLALAWASVLLLAGGAGVAPAADQADQRELLARSLVSMGDTSRLQHLLAKARRGEPLVIAVIGGSITQGASATTVENRYGNLIARWWRQRFPQVKVWTYVNAGLGATGSDIAACRAQQDLIRHQPDFVICEFAVNDEDQEASAETLEGLTRQILKSPNQPAVMYLFTMRRNGANAQALHSPVRRHYGVPMVSFRDALWPEIEAGRIKWEDVEADVVHPNDRGHRHCADFVTAVLDRIYAELPEDARLPQRPALPKPLIGDAYESTAIHHAGNLKPTHNQGWQLKEQGCFGPDWWSDVPGSVLEFELEGQAINLVFLKIKRDMGMVRVQVDDRPAVKMDARFEADWGGYQAWEQAARDLPPGKHKLRIELLAEKAATSAGHRFELDAIMVAGVSPRPH